MNKQDINEIIQLFDSYMISNGKKTIHLRTANYLIKQNTKFEKINLKELLNNGSIKNAYQTSTVPKQWIFEYSNIDDYSIHRKQYLKDNPTPIVELSGDIQKSGKKNYNWIFIGIILIVIFYFNNRVDKITNPEELKSKACIISREYVEQKLLSSSTADFGFCSENKVTYLGNYKFQVVNTVDATNVFGAKIRKKYFVILSYGKGDWTNSGN
jgi:hypothetical protein